MNEIVKKPRPFLLVAKKLAVAVIAGFCLFTVAQILKPATVHAGGNYGPWWCGDASHGDGNNYAGLTVQLVWRDYLGGLHEATGPVGAHVETWGGTYSPPGNVLELPYFLADPDGDGVGNLSGSESQAGRYFAMDFGQMWRPDCAQFGDGLGVVLDLGSDWVLDCDTNLHPWTQEFWVYGWGTPDGAEPLGSWSQLWVNPGNGDQKDITLVYDSPPPPPPTVDILVNGSANPPPILINGGITVSWTSQNASECHSDGGTWGSGVGKVVPNGSEGRPSDDDTTGTKTYYIVCSGPGGSVPDSVSIVVNAPSLPDFIPISLNRSIASPTVGQTLTFSGQVRNQGTANAGASSARFCIDSGNSVNCLNSATNRVGSDISVPALNAGVTSGVLTSTSWTATAGNHTVYWCADTLGQWFESDEGNNCTSQTFTVGAAPLFTIQAHIFRVNSSGTYLGEVPNISLHTCSPSGIERFQWRGASPFEGYVYFQAPQAESFCVRINNSPPAGYTGPYVRPWAEGYRYPGDNCLAFTGPPYSNHCNGSTYEWQNAGGNYANGGNSGGYYDRTSDTGYDFVYVQIPAQPDYVVDYPLPAPTDAGGGSLTPGEPVTFRATIRNQGGAGTASPSTTRWNIDINNDGSFDFPPSPNYVGTSGLAANGTELEIWSGVWTAAVGTHRFEICADTPSSIVESNETNNCTTAWFTINPLAPSTPEVAQICVGSTITARINWSGTAGIGIGPSGENGFWVDIDNDSSSLNGSYHRWYPASGTGSFSITDAPTGFNGYGGQSGALTLNGGASYRIWVNNGTDSQVIPFNPLPCVVSVPTCGGVTVNPSIPQPGEPFNLTFNFTISPAATSSSTYSITMTIAAGVTVPGGSPTPANPQTMAVGGTGGTATYNGLTAAAAGQYSGTFTVSGGYNLSCPFDGLLGHPPPLTIAVKPYLRVYGGDVMTGFGFGNNCSKNSNAQITAYNQGGAGAYAGAGAQFAVQAYGAVDQFVSAMLRTSASPPGVPKGLTFANSSFEYGTSFGSAHCVKDYFSGHPGTSTSSSTIIHGFPNGSNSGTYYYTPPVGTRLLLNPNNSGNSFIVNQGQKIIIYVSGDVFLQDDVLFQNSTTWSAISQIPSFYLIARGNIYINSRTTNLDGVFIAQDDGSGNKGRIYTCVDNNGNLVPNGSLITVPASGNNYVGCNSKLTVNGAFMAKQVKFLRTNGTLRDSAAGEGDGDSSIAEVFRYSPELWLINPGLTSGGALPFDAVTSLPPVL